MRHLQAAILLLVCAAVGGRGDLAAVDPEVVFSDDFTEALGERWQVVQGAWEVREGELVRPETLLHQEVPVLPDSSQVEAGRPVAAVDDLMGVVDGLSDQLCTGLGARRPVAQPPGLGLRILEATVLEDLDVLGLLEGERRKLKAPILRDAGRDTREQESSAEHYSQA